MVRSSTLLVLVLRISVIVIFFSYCSAGREVGEDQLEQLLDSENTHIFTQDVSGPVVLHVGGKDNMHLYVHMLVLDPQHESMGCGCMLAYMHVQFLCNCS